MGNGTHCRRSALQCLNKNKRGPLNRYAEHGSDFSFNTHRKDSAFFSLQSFSWINWFLQKRKWSRAIHLHSYHSYGLYNLPNSLWQYLHKNLGQASVAVSSADYRGSPAQLRFQEWEIRANKKKKQTPWRVFNIRSLPELSYDAILNGLILLEVLIESIFG